MTVAVVAVMVATIDMALSVAGNAPTAAPWAVGDRRGAPPTPSPPLPTSLITTTRVETQEVHMCTSPVIAATATCPCYFGLVLVADAPGAVFTATLRPTAASAAAHRWSAADRAVLSAASIPTTAADTSYHVPGAGPNGSIAILYMVYGVRQTLNVVGEVELLVDGAPGVGARPRWGGPGAVERGRRAHPSCPLAAVWVLEAVEPACVARDIGVGGDGRALRAVARLEGGGGFGAGHLGTLLGADGWSPPHSRGPQVEGTLPWARGMPAPRRRNPHQPPSVLPISRFVTATPPPFPPHRQDAALPLPTARIVGGVPLTEDLAAAFVVRVSSTYSMCSGALVSPRHVITAAHCDLRPGDTVELLRHPPDAGVLTVIATAAHPRWEPTTLAHDLAVVTLDADAPGYYSGRQTAARGGGGGGNGGGGRGNDDRTPPAVVNHDPAVPAVGSGVRAAGFGITSPAWALPIAPTAADDARTVDVQVVPDAPCVVAFAEAEKADETILWRGPPLATLLHPRMHVCAGVATGGCDACQGDSGGPLYQSALLPRVHGSGGDNDTGRVGDDAPVLTYVLVGVTSFSPGCATAGTPTAYTRLSSYAGWIDSVVGAGTGPVRPDGGRVGGGNDPATYDWAPQMHVGAPAPTAVAGGGGGGGGAAATAAAPRVARRRKGSQKRKRPPQWATGRTAGRAAGGLGRMAGRTGRMIGRMGQQLAATGTGRVPGRVPGRMAGQIARRMTGRTRPARRRRRRGGGPLATATAAAGAYRRAPRWGLASPPTPPWPWRWRRWRRAPTMGGRGGRRRRRRRYRQRPRPARQRRRPPGGHTA